MKIKLKKTNVKRLASLTALSAGTLGIAAGPAEAGDVFWSGIVDKKVGFDKGFGTRADIAGPHGAGGILGVTAFSCCSMTLFTGRATVLLGEKHGSHGTSFRFINAETKSGDRSLAAALPSGAAWGTAFHGKSANRAPVAQWYLDPEAESGTRRETAFTAANRYLLFRFTGGDLRHDMYGWAQLSVTFAKGAPYRFPDVVLIDWAFDTSGAQLPAGDRGAPQLIGRDSSALAPTGIAALALGANGVRAWRAGRNGATGTQY